MIQVVVVVCVGQKSIPFVHSAYCDKSYFYVTYSYYTYVFDMPVIYHVSKPTKLELRVSESGPCECPVRLRSSMPREPKVTG